MITVDHTFCFCIFHFQTHFNVSPGNGGSNSIAINPNTGASECRTTYSFLTQTTRNVSQNI